MTTAHHAILPRLHSLSQLWRMHLNQVHAGAYFSVCSNGGYREAHIGITQSFRSW
jgi:hypothetical protein